MRRHFFTVLITFLFLVFNTACKHQPLYYMGNAHYIRVYLNEELLNVNKGFYNEDYVRPTYNRPEIVKVALCDPQSGKVVAERFLRDKGQDEQGIYYEGYIVCPIGKYKLLAYNFGTFTTIIGNNDNYYDAHAYCNVINSTFDQIPRRSDPSSKIKTVYEPDFLFVDSNEVNITPSIGIDTLYNQVGKYFVANSLVKTYYTQIKVKGLEHVQSVSGYFAEVSNEVTLHNSAIQYKPVSLYFDMNIDKQTDTDGVIYGTFNTFGILDMSGLSPKNEIAFDFVTIYGMTMTASVDINSALVKPEATNNQWLLLDMTIEIIPPEPGEGGGGLNPGVDKWKDISTDVFI